MSELHNDILVSIIVPAYNAEKYIEETILSAVAQTHTNWEMFVIDDGSQDGTADIVQRMAAEDNRIHFCKNEKNMGVAKTRNRGFDMAQGQYIALLDSDDVWYPQKLEKQLGTALDTQAGLVYASYQIIDTDGNKCKNDYIVAPTTDFESLLKENIICCSSMLVKKEWCTKHRFSGEYAHEDYVFGLRLLKDGCKAVGVEDILLKYRFYIGSRSANKLLAAKNRWIIYRKYLKLSLLKSGFSMVNYAFAGLRKYR